MSAAVGADIAALCSKCGDVWHVIVAKVEEDIVKVQCKECGGYHRYRTAAGKAAKRATTKTTKPRAKKVVEKHETPAVVADLSRPVRSYGPMEKYEPGDRVEHSTFGQGTVEIIDGTKMTVFFAVGRKVLVHDKGEGGASARTLARPKPFDNSGPQAGKPVSE